MRVALWLILCARAVAAQSGTVVLLTDRALDGRGGTLRGARISIDSGRISSVNAPAGGRATTIDLSGYTVLPGWIDRGFPGPRVLTSLSPIQGDSSLSTDSLRALVRRRKDQGADLIKIFASKSQRVGAGPTFTEDQLRVLCGEAAALGLRTMVHSYRSQTSAAARAGCRQIEHATYGTQADIDAAVKAGAFLGPQVGLVVQNYLANRQRYLASGMTEEGMQIMERDLPLDFAICAIAVKSGAKVVFSTDATAGAHGRNAEEFIGRVEHCGQSPMAALVSANSLAAEAIGMKDQLGALAPGYEADIIALDGDPLTDMTAVRRVVFVMRGGMIYKWTGVKAK